MPGLTCAIHQPNFFPRFSTLAKLCAADIWIVLDNVQFTRRDYQNRCYLPDAGPALPARWLTVPVHLPDGRATLIRDTRLADPGLTVRRVRGLIHQYFRSRPHWPAVSALLPEAEDAISSSCGVAEVSERMTIALLRMLQWQGTICRSSDIPAGQGRSERLADLVTAVGAATYLCGTGGRRYLDPAPFTIRGIHVEFFTPPAPLADVGPDARRVTALADLASVGPQALAAYAAVRSRGRPG